jgi:predicted anti-sigma-YlaC factor YlaD
MNCKLCRKELNAYRQGTLPGDIRSQVESHLQGCRNCAGIYKLLIVAERVMNEEKKLKSDPFLPTRVMARIEEINSPAVWRIPVFTRLAKPVVLVLLLAFVIALGVTIGSMYRFVPERDSLPAEMSLIDDATIESVSFLSNDQN